MGFDELWEHTREILGNDKDACYSIIGEIAKNIKDKAGGSLEDAFQKIDSKLESLYNIVSAGGRSKPRALAIEENDPRDVASNLFEEFGEGIETNRGGGKRKRRNRTNRLYKKRRNTKRRNTKNRNTKRRV